ncbi:MAG TPA: RIP metalloprotease RseP [Candidatus Polarisedimenticolia bacterium]|nr:RIP metalloprotease RseP [Candidatus Polarisedimenticolia bacterium]
MSWSVGGLLPFVGVLGSVVLFHEFGHYLAAKFFKVTVEVFSVGFGPRLWGFTRRGTEYRLSWVPLGGYVKLRGESEDEKGAPPDPGDLMSHPRWQRWVIFVMGAVFNLATALGLTTVVFMRGVQEFAYLYEAPVVGEIDPESPAKAAGIEPGDRIVEFAGEPVSTWKDLQLQMMLSPRQTRMLTLERDGARRSVELTIEATENDVGRPGVFPATGVLVGSLESGWPAEAAGLARGDRIVSIDGVPMSTVTRVYEVIQAAPGKELAFVIERAGKTFDTRITPRDDAGKGRIGFRPTPPTITRAYPFLEAARHSFDQNVESIGLVFETFRKLIKRELSFRAFSGPVDLYKFSGEAAEEGLVPFLQLIAFVSLQLGIINLFPIPPLDGGHLFTITVEGLIRRDLSTALKERVMQAGLIVLLVFMATVIYFDITKNFFR